MIPRHGDHWAARRRLARSDRRSRRPHRPALRRTLAVERLEDRRLLSGVTLITHGFNSNVDGWVTAMAEAILQRPDLNVDQPRYVVEVTDPGHDHGPLSVVNTSRTGPLPTAPDTRDPELVILLDWSDVAGTLSLQPYARSSVDVAAAVAEKLLVPGFLGDLPTAVAELPFHLIGHSRGASLVGELARQLGLRGVWVDQVTTLDPHPVDGVREPPPPFQFDWDDAAMTGWENVVFWDNYWRTDGDHSFDFTGEPIPQTHDVPLVESILTGQGYGYEHSDVHLWYFGTIDTSTDPPANNGDYDVPNGWYGGSHPSRTGSGYHFSRTVGGTRPDSGLSEVVGGTAQREPIDWGAAVWPNLLKLQSEGQQFQVGQTIPADFCYQDADSGATVTFSLDADRNPYNGNQLPLGQYELGSTGTDVLCDRREIPTAAASPGSYHLSARIVDPGGRGRYAYLPGTITLLPAPDAEIVGRYVFYNNSVFDADAGASPSDDQAIAPDKAALLPGQTATLANYISYSRGINGIMVDIAGMPPGAVLQLDDFLLRTGNSNTPSSWIAAPSPSTITMRPGAGADGSDRVTLLWADGAIQKQWLQVTVLATANTRLVQEDVFYFGNAVGETGNSATDAKVNSFDMLGARDNPRSFLNPAPITFAYDFNRDARVNSTDMLVARDNPTSFLNALKLITVPGAKAEAGVTARPQSPALLGHGLALPLAPRDSQNRATPLVRSTDPQRRLVDVLMLLEASWMDS